MLGTIPRNRRLMQIYFKRSKSRFRRSLPKSLYHFYLLPWNDWITKGKCITKNWKKNCIYICMYVYIRGSIAFNNTCFFEILWLLECSNWLKISILSQFSKLCQFLWWKSAWIDKNSHISSPSNPTEMCQTFLESSDNNLC